MSRFWTPKLEYNLDELLQTEMLKFLIAVIIGFGKNLAKRLDDELKKYISLYGHPPNLIHVKELVREFKSNNPAGGRLRLKLS